MRGVYRVAFDYSTERSTTTPDDSVNVLADNGDEAVRMARTHILEAPHLKAVGAKTVFVLQRVEFLAAVDLE